MEVNINKINKKLNKQYGDDVKAFLNEKNHSIVVKGKLDNWNDIVAACYICVIKNSDYHVVNKIELLGAKDEPMEVPIVEDKALDQLKVDVLVIGGGIIGASVTRELTKWDIDVLLVEKQADLAMQASGRNDGEVHPGVDQKKHNLKLKYELIGNRMYADLCKDLDVPFKREGQYVAFKGKYMKPILDILAASRRKLGVDDTRVISKKELYEANPHLNKGYDWGLYNPTAGSVCPYGLTIAYGENAVSNGAKVSLNTVVKSMEVKDGHIISAETNRGIIYPKVVVNAAGVFADKIAEMANDEFFSIHPRKGTDVLLDKKVGYLNDKIVSYKELVNKDKNTKGGGVVSTVHDNILIGPDAHETYKREDYSTSKESISWLFNKQQKTIPALNQKDIITYFSGVRAPNFEEDFIIEKGRETSNIYHIAAIQSPGLTAAPAIAIDAAKQIIEMLGGAKENKNYNPIRKAVPVLNKMDDANREKLIKENSDYGVIVCRCEEISKGEIIDCLKSNICVPTLDGIKRRIRPGMGRCQGGFCSPLVSKIISEYMHMDIKDVTKNGNESFVTYGETK